MDISISLGHNSTAVGFDGSKILAGYEEERLTRQKSSSAYPHWAIKNLPDKEINRIFVSHWYDNYSIDNLFTTKNATINRHFDQTLSRDLFNQNNAEVLGLSDEFTHHDSHAYSAIAFFENNCDKVDYLKKTFYIFVSDGFGNKQEVVSVYRGSYSSKSKLTLNKVLSVRGYEKSLGLLYQYATSFVGMKENEDEYKFLGYESHILSKFKDVQIDYITARAKHYVIDWLSNAESPSKCDTDLEYINLDYLLRSKNSFNATFSNLLDGIPNCPKLDEFTRRVAIGFFIQQIIEGIYVFLLHRYDVENVMLVGGLHYNVKLNNRIHKEVKGFVSIMPLAGDQGTTIGTYRYYNKKVNFKSLLLGKRKLKNISSNPMIKYIKKSEDLVEYVSSELKKDHMVQVVTGNMELGPRALCNTSMLALPSSENIEFINAINGRNTVMPMAPVMLDRNLGYFFEESDYSRTVGSDKYMILTYDYKNSISSTLLKKYAGVMHKYPLTDVYSGRPQVIDNKDRYIYKVLDEVDRAIDYKTIINHSYNIHGRPIVFNENDAIEDFSYQMKRCDELGLDKNRVSLVIADCEYEF